MFPSKLLYFHLTMNFLWRKITSNTRNNCSKLSCTKYILTKESKCLIGVWNVDHFFLFPFSWDVAPAAIVTVVFALLLDAVKTKNSISLLLWFQILQLFISLLKLTSLSPKIRLHSFFHDNVRSRTVLVSISEIKTRQVFWGVFKTVFDAQLLCDF